MAKPVEELIVQIKADTRQLQRELDQIKGRINVVGSAGSAAFGAAGGGLAAKLKGIKGPAAVATATLVGLGAAIVPIARVGMGFEDLKDSLNTVFGSITQGDAAFDKILTFAQTTPFQVEDVTKAFIQLKGAGIEPNMEMMQTFADTASTSIDQLGAFEAMVRLVQRSAAGGLGLEEINMLDDRGIPATKILTEALGRGREELSEFGKTAEGAAQMVDALIKGMQERFGGAMESKMDNLSTKASNMMIAFRELADAIFQSKLADGLKFLADRLGEMATNAARAMRMSSGLFNLADVGVDTDETAFSQLIDVDARIDELENTRARGAAHTQKMTELNRLNELRLGLVTRITQELEKAEEIESKGLKAATQDNVDFLTEFKKLAEDSVPELQKITDQLAKVVDLRGKVDAEGNLLATDEEIERVLAFLRDLRDEAEDVSETFDEQLKQAVINSSNAFTNDFVNSLMEGESALESFKDLAQNLVSQIISIFLQMGVINEILNSIFKLNGTNNALPTFSNTKAGGGRVQKGVPTLVGERGMELFIPNTGGTIMNNMNTQNALGGSTPVVVNQSLNFSTGVVPTVRAEVTKNATSNSRCN